MRALVTGASGFIGSTLIEELAGSGIEAIALMRASSSAANLKGLRYTRVEGDISDLESLRNAVRGMDYVFHLAGLTAAPTREAYFECNVGGTTRLARAALEAAPGLKRFVLVSSLAAGGPSPTREPRTEADDDEPVSAYGESKLEGERELLKLRDRIPVTIIRPPMVYGPKDKGVFVIVQSVARRFAPVIPSADRNGGHKHYSAIHSRDLARALAQTAVASGVPSGEVFYVADDRSYTYDEILDVVSRHVGTRPLRFKVPPVAVKALAHGAQLAARALGRTFPLNVDKLNEILPDYWVCSNAKARRELGFKPELDFERGMADAVAWYKDQKWI